MQLHCVFMHLWLHSYQNQSTLLAVARNLVEAIRLKQERIVQLQEEIHSLKAELKEARAILAGRSLKPKGPRKRSADVENAVSKRNSRQRPMREGSTVWWAENLLRHYGAPMHIDRLLVEIQQASTKPVAKPTIVSNLSRYIKNGDTFTRTAESTYGLLEFEIGREGS
jgi:hypothetical protein